jgi:regulation of enolase protein 1 (concanavalin A-like superfamily)
MHNAKSFNYPEGFTLPPVWLKMERHGNSFSGYYSFDGEHWVLSRSSGDILGLGETMDIGLAAGTNDQRPALVKFEDFKLIVEKHDN